MFLINSIFRIFFFVGHIIPDYRILEILPFAFVAAVIGAFSGNYIFSRVPVSVIQKGVYSLMVLVGFLLYSLSFNSACDDMTSVYLERFE